jgi:hypothetical protein
MWPFRKRESPKKSHHVMRRFIAGAIIGGAIASIIGKTLLEKHEKGEDDEGESEGNGA